MAIRKKTLKFVCLLLSSAVIFAVSGCGGKSQESSFASVSVSDSQPKTAVVYYSATGNTREAAKIIAQKTNASLLEIEPEDPYTSEDLNYNDPQSRVSIEHADPDLQTVSLHDIADDQWDEYEIIYLGYPVWWGVSSWVVDSFVQKTDFDGKKVYPFCTSASSPVGTSGERLASHAKNGTWHDSVRFSSSPDENEIIQWLDSLEH